MAKTLLIISIVLTLVAAVFGFLTKQNVDRLNADLKARRLEVAGLKNDKAKLTADLKKTTDDLTAANKTIDDVKGQLQVATNDLATTKADLEKSKMAQADAEAKVASMTADLDKVKAQLDELEKQGVKPEQLVQLKTDLDKAKTELAESRQVADTLKTRAAEFEAKNGALTTELNRYKLQIQKPGITGRVVAVNNGWNFVVVDVGDKRGATLNAQLLVMRGGQTVARLKVTSVEPSSSIADVIPGSMARGQSVQPGDTVIFAGRQNMNLGAPEGGEGAAGGARTDLSASLPTGGQ